jgi:phosphohistidine phosphatase
MIWLLRHGEAEDTAPDELRKLTPKGRKQARAAGEALSAMGVELEACLSSPRVRAAETARIACESLGVEITSEPRLGGGGFDAEQLVAGLSTVLLVGHEPDFSRAVGDLTGARIQLKKGGLAAVDDRELKLLLRPRHLRAIASAG